MKIYQVFNADGMTVAEYDEGAHAVESAEWNAANGSAENHDFYTVTRADGETDDFCGDHFPVGYKLERF